MAGYYNKNRKFYLEQLDIEDVVCDLENNFENTGADAVTNFKEALQWYDMILENAGKICEEYIEPRAEAVDEKGAFFSDGVVSWAPETVENMNMLAKAGYMGGTLPRKYGGLNLPLSVFNIIVEMVSQADASLMNLFGLQDIAVTLYRFGNEEQKDRVLPKFCRGEVSGSMALTEPDAGSDLQAVQLRALEKDGKWYLDGVKRFITNGCGDVSLVLARSEKGSKGGRGLSMFLYERYRDDNMQVRRIENKMGIHGSPTCELQFNMAGAELVGRRKFGLIKYVMSLMNGARVAVSAQALGIAQQAYEESVKYANEREQFGRKIVEMPMVYQILKNMEVAIETSRILLYRTNHAVDIMDMYERKMESGEEVRKEYKYYKKLADFLTPLSKFVITEMANKVAYDAIQIHGGVGYMKDFPVERLYRDARITNIYEGTTQLQVVACIGSITSGFFTEEMQKIEALEISELSDEHTKTLKIFEDFNNITQKVRELKNKEFTEFTAPYLVEMASIIFRLYLMLPVAEKYSEKRENLRYFLNESEANIFAHVKRINGLVEKFNGQTDNFRNGFFK